MSKITSVNTYNTTSLQTLNGYSRQNVTALNGYTLLVESSSASTTFQSASPSMSQGIGASDLFAGACFEAKSTGFVTTATWLGYTFGQGNDVEVTGSIYSDIGYRVGSLIGSPITVVIEDSVGVQDYTTLTFTWSTNKPWLEAGTRYWFVLEKIQSSPASSINIGASTSEALATNNLVTGFNVAQVFSGLRYGSRLDFHAEVEVTVEN